MIYALWELTAFIGCYTKKNKKILYWALVILMIALMAFRSFDLGIRDTSGTYLTLYNKCNSHSLSYCLMGAYVFEPLFIIYAWILSQLGDFRLFVAITSVVCILPIAIYINKFSLKPFDSLLIYFSLFYFYDAYLIKQMTAMVFVLYSYKYIKSGKFVKFAIFIILAGLVHRTAYILILLYPACKFIRYNKKSLFIIIAAFVIGLYGGQYILDLVYKVGYSNYEILINNGIYKTDFGFNFSMLFYPAVTYLAYRLASCGKNKKDIKDQTIEPNYIIALVGCVFNIWALIVGEFYRLAIFCLIVLVIQIPNSIFISNYKYKKYVALLLRVFLIVYSFKIALNTNCLPYQFM